MRACVFTDSVARCVLLSWTPSPATTPSTPEGVAYARATSGLLMLTTFSESPLQAISPSSTPPPAMYCETCLRIESPQEAVHEREGIQRLALRELRGQKLVLSENVN